MMQFISFFFNQKPTGRDDWAGMSEPQKIIHQFFDFFILKTAKIK